MKTVTGTTVFDLDLTDWRAAVCERVAEGARFAGLYGSHTADGVTVHVLLATASGIDCLRCSLAVDESGDFTYPSLTRDVPPAFWYERAMHDLSGVVPLGHPRLDPLLLPRDAEKTFPRPGGSVSTHRDLTSQARATDRKGPVDVGGHGLFTLPFGPVRSGVFESIEFLIETPGEDIPHLTIRPHYKHRGIAKRFEGLTVDDGVLVAERVEGIASVAHALAFAHAVEALADITPAPRARLIRVLHAELERIANHLDVVIRLCDAAGLAVATSRFGWHKEETMRLVSAMCGNRFGRSVVVVGGINVEPAIDAATIADRIAKLHSRIRADRRALMESASFLDRLRDTGHLDPELAAGHGALGPVGRGSGFDDDARRHRRYDAYAELPPIESAVQSQGDVMARLRVRWSEIDTAVILCNRVCRLLARLTPDPPSLPTLRLPDGFATGWAEAPQGEVLYGLELRDGVIGRCFARSASLHNMPLFHDVFGHDVFTDLPFIEASFGLSYAGVAM